MGTEDIRGEVRGDVHVVDGVLTITRVHVEYHLRLGPEHREVVERVLEVHAAKCPVAKSIGRAITITTAVRFG